MLLMDLFVCSQQELTQAILVERSALDISALSLHAHLIAVGVLDTEQLSYAYSATARAQSVILLKTIITFRVTTWNRVCGKVSNFHQPHFFTADTRQKSKVGDRVYDCKLGGFHDTSFAGDCQIRNPSGRMLSICADRTLVPISWMFKKQQFLSHSYRRSGIFP